MAAAVFNIVRQCGRFARFLRRLLPWRAGPGQGTYSMESSGSECAADSNSANDPSFVRIVRSRSRCSNANTRIGTSLVWIPQTRASACTVGADRCSRKSASLTSRLDGASMRPVIRVSRVRNRVLTVSLSAEESSVRGRIEFVSKIFTRLARTPARTSPSVPLRQPFRGHPNRLSPRGPRAPRRCRYRTGGSAWLVPAVALAEARRSPCRH